MLRLAAPRALAALFILLPTLASAQSDPGVPYGYQQPQPGYPAAPPAPTTADPAQPAYPQQPYPQQPYPQQAYPQYPQQAYPQQAYPQQAYAQQAYPQYPQQAYPQYSQPGYAPYASGYGQPAMDPRLFAEYNALPRRRGTMLLGVFGGLFLLGGIAQTVTAATGACTDYYGGTVYSSSSGGCADSGVVLAMGLGQIGVGGLMTYFTVRRVQRRRAGIASLRQRGAYWLSSGAGSSRGLRLDLALTPYVVAPSVSLRF